MYGLEGAELVAGLAAVFMIGALIGSVGIGGLLLAPMLVRFAGLGVREAIAVSMASFIATGLVALWLFARGRSAFRERWVLVAATMPGALLGALALWALPEAIAVAALAIFLVATGLRLLVARHAPEAAGERISHSTDAQIGAATGFLSAMTGTGGPMVLVPVLAWRGAPLLTAIALGQIIQLPVAGVATIGNYASGSVDLMAATVIGLVLMPGVAAGRWAIEMIPVALVTRVVAVLLVAAGFWLAWKMV
jgi:uncharacterized membrane protein YfcA